MNEKSAFHLGNSKEIIRRLLAVSPWTVGSCVTLMVSILWAVSNLQQRATAYQNKLDSYSEQVQGTVAEHDVSTAISGTKVYIGKSSSPQYDTTALSQTLMITAKYVVNGKEYEVTGFVSDRTPNVGESVTVYYAPGYPANAHLRERLHDWAQGSADRYVHPAVIWFVGIMLSAGLWYYGRSLSKRFRVES